MSDSLRYNYFMTNAENSGKRDDEWESLMKGLQKEEPTLATGWFRWMHLSFVLRMRGIRGAYGEIPVTGAYAWKEAAQWLFEKGRVPDADGVARLCKLAERDVWSLGMSQAIFLVEILWADLSPLARGRVLAGFSEALAEEVWGSRRAASEVSPRKFEWLLGKVSRLDSITWDAVSATQVACNSVLLKESNLLGQVLRTASEWGEGEVVRLESLDRGVSEVWLEEVEALSERALDRCLEGAVRVGNVGAARLCLEAGADPDLAIWCLNRSFHERHSALSYVMREIRKEEGKELIEVLLDAGADPRGSEFGGQGKPLFLALWGKDWDLAEELLNRGAQFPGAGDSDTAGKSGVRWNLGRDTAKLNWIEREIGSLLPLVPVIDGTSFWLPHAQGGDQHCFLDPFWGGDDVELLRRFEARGLSMRLSAPDVLSAVRDEAWNSLGYVLARLEAPDEVMGLLRGGIPD
jgi:hypothetical protein